MYLSISVRHSFSHSLSPNTFEPSSSSINQHHVDQEELMSGLADVIAMLQREIDVAARRKVCV